MSDFMVTNYDFENAKQHIRRFAENYPDSLELTFFETDEGFLDLFDHKVTGRELNVLVNQLKDHFIEIQQREQQLTEEFGQVYNALESLNEDYIEGIVSAAITAHEADRKAQSVKDSLGNTNKSLGEFAKYQNKKNQEFSKFGLYDKALYDRKLKIAYALAGGGILLTILQFVFNMMGIM